MIFSESKKQRKWIPNVIPRQFSCQAELVDLTFGDLIFSLFDVCKVVILSVLDLKAGSCSSVVTEPVVGRISPS